MSKIHMPDALNPILRSPGKEREKKKKKKKKKIETQRETQETCH